jgi:hypothetical protein
MPDGNTALLKATMRQKESDKTWLIARQDLIRTNKRLKSLDAARLMQQSVSACHWG